MFEIRNEFCTLYGLWEKYFNIIAEFVISGKIRDIIGKIVTYDYQIKKKLENKVLSMKNFSKPGGNTLD
jgi:hypothetical protein